MRQNLIRALAPWLAALAATMSMAAVPRHAAAHGVAAAAAPDDSGRSQVQTHGGDPAGVDAGTEAPAPSGGPVGMRLSGTARAEATAESVSSSLPSRWCGEERRDDHVVNELDNGTHKFHGIYMLPSDGASRLASLASTFQADALQASALLERLYGRAIRFDMGTTCGPQYLDITTVRMSESRQELADLAGKPAGTVSAVKRALDRAGFATLNSVPQDAGPLEENYLVWLDGPATPGFCGEADLYNDTRRDPANANNWGGKVAAVFRSSTGFCGSNAVRHEIGHTLGAIQDGAPNAFDGAHCDDSYEDTMCYRRAPSTGSGVFGAEHFDYNNDDYWDPEGGSLPWWTVNLSAFLCPDATCNVPTGYESDRDGDLEPDTSDNCPGEPNADQRNRFGDTRGDACEPFNGRVRMKARRKGRHWKINVVATGDGRGRLIVTCRRASRRTAVLSRTIDLPDRLRKRARCGGRPRARLVPSAR